MSQGLDEVIAADTILSDVDGALGRLIIRGEPVAALAEEGRFADAALMLFDGFFDQRPDAQQFRSDLGAARAAAFTLIAADPRPLALPPLEAARALIARRPDGEDLQTAVWLLAAVATATAASIRCREGRPLIPPEPGCDHAEDILRMCGLPSDPAAAHALGAYLSTVIDHGLNASTFAARVVASTRAGLTSSVIAGLSALKGPLHGGAPGPVADMLDDIGAPENARPWLEAALARGDRLMGFGHRIYRVRDPRADALKAVIATLAVAKGADLARLRYAEAVEAAALEVLKAKKPARPLETNVEFYTAILLEGLGFPRDGFSGVFAIGRTAGWIAHAREQALSGRLIRPQSRYIGPAPDLAA